MVDVELDRHWEIRNNNDEIDPNKLYGVFNAQYFTIRLFHGGRFTEFPFVNYSPATITYIDFVNVKTFSLQVLQDIFSSLGYNDRGFFYRIQPEFGLNYGLLPLENYFHFHEFIEMISFPHCNSVYRIYGEVGRKSVDVFYPDTLWRAPEEMIYGMIIRFVDENEDCNADDARYHIFKTFGVFLPKEKVEKAWEKAAIKIQYYHSMGLYLA